MEELLSVYSTFGKSRAALYIAEAAVLYTLQRPRYIIRRKDENHLYLVRHPPVRRILCYKGSRDRRHRRRLVRRRRRRHRCLSRCSVLNGQTFASLSRLNRCFVNQISLFLSPQLSRILFFFFTFARPPLPLSPSCIYLYTMCTVCQYNTRYWKNC